MGVSPGQKEMAFDRINKMAVKRASIVEKKSKAIFRIDRIVKNTHYWNHITILSIFFF